MVFYPITKPLLQFAWKLQLLFIITSPQRNQYLPKWLLCSYTRPNLNMLKPQKFNWQKWFFLFAYKPLLSKVGFYSNRKPQHHRACTKTATSFYHKQPSKKSVFALVTPLVWCQVQFQHVDIFMMTFLLLFLPLQVFVVGLLQQRQLGATRLR